MDETFDVVVAGIGGMGSATLYQLAARTASVCGIERYRSPHDRGSSHGKTRLIRKGYLESPQYVPLLERSYQLWAELEEECREQLLVETGLVIAGSPESSAVQGQSACYSKYPLEHERMNASEARQRFPQLDFPDHWTVFTDPAAGFLRVEECVQQHIRQAKRRGAQLYQGEEVLSWDASGSGVLVRTTKRTLSCGRLILCLGAWARAELIRLGVKTDVIRKVLFWYDSPNIELYRLSKLPCFLIDTDKGIFYGFPAVDEMGLKVAEHEYSYEVVPDPLAVDRNLHAGDEEPVLEFLRNHFPGLREPHRTDYGVCMYTMTPDSHFVIDTHPLHQNVLIAGGFSGHGFKFAPVVGEILADLAEEGSTCHPVEFLRIDRFLDSQTEAS